MRKFITRTLNNVYVKCGCINPKTLEVFEQVFRVKNIRKPELLLPKLQKKYNSGDLSVISVIAYESKKTQYRISEEDFIKYAQEVKGEIEEWDTEDTETEESE